MERWINDKKINVSCYLYLCLLGLANPAGVIVGYLLAGIGPLYVAVFESVSVGTFVYVSTFEILNEEFKQAR